MRIALFLCALTVSGCTFEDVLGSSSPNPSQMAGQPVPGDLPSLTLCMDSVAARLMNYPTCSP